MNTQHTSLPWTHMDHGAETSAVFAGEDQDLIADTRTIGDAAFIVRACNAHDELLAACQLFTEAAHAARDALNGVGLACPSSIAFAAEQARAAIAKAVQS